jgi:prevent-host-death family protein
MRTLTVSQVRANLRSALERVKNGEEIVLTQNGEAVAVLVHPSQLRARRPSPLLDAAAGRLEELQEARRRRPERGPGINATRAEQLVAELRRARDEG